MKSFLARSVCLLAAALLSACSTARSTYPPGGTPISSAKQVVGTWVSSPSQSFWAGSSSAIRFNPDGTGLFVGHANFSNQRLANNSWTYESNFRHWQGADTLRVQFGPYKSLAGDGVMGLRSGWQKEAPVWLENGKLRIGRGADGKNYYSRTPALNSVNLTEYALSGGVNSGQRGTGADFYDGLQAARNALATVHTGMASAQGRQGGGDQSAGTRASTANTNNGGVVNGSFSTQEIQQLFGSSGLAVDVQINRGKDVYRFYGIPQAQAEQMYRSAQTYTAAGHQSVNKIGQPYRIQAGRSYRVGQEKVR